MAVLTALPDGSRYNIAVQNPAVAFRDPRLKAGRPTRDRLGLPAVSSGGFAVAYRLETPTGTWAVRCFTRLTDGLDHRYAKVASFLAANPAAHWLPVDFQREGLLVDRQWWPVTVMPWVDALPLNEWVAGHLTSPHLLTQTAQRFAEIVRELERSGAAHADMQHGNILVRPDGALVLIDYDGMFVPGLEGQQMPEVGHPNYQHPGRGTAVFGPGLDRFSAAVIWTALAALARIPLLWESHDTGENILFTAKDFQDPGQSELLRFVRSDTALAPLADGIDRLLRVSVDRLPTLDDFVAGRLPDAEPAAINFGAVAAFPILDLRRPRVLDGRQGQRVTAVGEIVDVHRGATYRGDPYLFATISGRQPQSLKVVLWSETLNRLSPPQKTSLRKGAVIGVTGTLGEYDGKPQIVLDRPALLELLGDDRITGLLGSRWVGKPPEATTNVDLAVGDVVEHATFGQGVVISVKGDAAHIRFAADVKHIAFRKYPLRFVHRPAPRPAASTARQRPPARTTASSGAPQSAPQRRQPSSGFANQQKEWERFIAASSGSTHRSASPPIAPRGRPVPAQPITPQPSRSASASQSGVARRTAWTPAVVSVGAFLTALLIAPSNDVVALGLGVAGLAIGGIALGRIR
jgi:hypothetical protein